MTPDVIQQIEEKNLQVVELIHQARYQQALQIAIQACELGQTLEEGNLIYAESLNNLGELYRMMGDYSTSEKLYRKAMKTAEKLNGGLNLQYASFMNNFAELCRLRGEYLAAEMYFLRACNIFETLEGDLSPNYAQCLNNLAVLYRVIGNYIKAEQLYRRVLIIRQAEYGDNHPYFATSLQNLARLYHTLGKYEEAERLYRQAIDILHDALPENHPDYAKSLNSLGVLYQTQGNFVAAKPLLVQSLEIRRKTFGEDHPDYAISLNNLATLYFMMGNFAVAEELFYKTLEIRRKVFPEYHPDYADSLNSLAELYHKVGKYDLAEKYLKATAVIRRNFFGKLNPAYAQSLNNLAALYFATGNFEEAEHLFHQAKDVWREAVGEAHLEYASSLNNLAEVYRAQADYDRAEPLYRQAKDIWQRTLGADHPNYASSLQNLAFLYLVMGRQAESFKLLQEAAAVDDRLIGQIFSIASETQRLAYIFSIQAHLHSYLSSTLQFFAKSPEALQSALDLVLRRKAIGAAALAAQRDAVLGGRYPDLQAQLQELNIWRRQIAQKTLAGPGPEGPAAHQEMLVEWISQKEHLEEELVRQIPEMNLEQKLRAADRQAVAQALPAGTALVEFVWFDFFDCKAVSALGEEPWKPAHYLGFVLLAEKPEMVQMIDLGEIEPIDRLIFNFRASITGEGERLENLRTEIGSPETADVSVLSERSVLRLAIVSATRHFRPDSAPAAPKDDTISGIALRQALFDPLKPFLGGCTRLFLAPDGELARLPFEVLPTDNGRRIIDDYQISYLGVGRDVLCFARPSLGQSTEPFVAADPDFDLGSHFTPQFNPGFPFQRLQDALLEGETIARLLRVEPVVGDRVLEITIKSRSSPRILHIATHGFFLPNPARDPNQEPAGVVMASMQSESRLGRLSAAENPLLRSGLALAGANTWLQAGSLPTEAEDGLLTAEDITALDLLGTELVVLSACETGLGEVQAGEGVFGLRRSFVLAGVRTLVMSLWKVPDQQTKELMEDFYRRILDGQHRAEALREAQRGMKKKYPEPFYWGAFICQGDPGPLG